MNLFGKEPQEQAMQSLIHDTNSALSGLEFHISNMSKWLKEFKHVNGDLINIGSAPYVYLEYLKSQRKELENAIDSYYNKFKNDFK